MKHQFWSLLLRLIFITTGFLLCISSIRNFGENVWQAKGILFLLLGLGLIIISVIVSLPKINRRLGGMLAIEGFSRYLIQASMWCFVSLIIIELTLRVTIYNPPLRRDVTNWAGDLPSVHSMILWGREGYAITEYEKWGEIRTPYHDSKKDNDVIVLGDSQTESLQVADDIKFPSSAETILRQDGYDVDLHNLGRSGLAMADYVSWIPAYQALYRPRIIVVQLTESDFVDSFHLGQFNYFIAQGNKIVDLYQTYDLSSGFSQRKRGNYYWNNFQLQELGLQRWSFMQKSGNKNVDEGAATDVFNPELAKQQMEMLISVSNGTPLIVVLLPSSPSISGDQLQLTDPVHERLKEFFAGFPGITIVDPSSEFQQIAIEGHLPRGFFNTTPHWAHLNKYGSGIVGQLLAKAIEQVVK